MTTWRKLGSTTAGLGLLAGLAVAIQVPAVDAVPVKVAGADGHEPGVSHDMHSLDMDAAAIPGSTRTPTGIKLANATALPRIKGYVGSDGTITINKRTVVKGRYRIVVNDDTTAHNWHISGPGDVDRKTTVAGAGTWSWRVRLRRGTYGIVCDPHASWMNTSLKVTRS